MRATTASLAIALLVVALFLLALRLPSGPWLVVQVTMAAGTMAAASWLRARIEPFGLVLGMAWLHPGWAATVGRGEGLRLTAWTLAASLAALVLVRVLGRPAGGSAPPAPRRGLRSVLAVLVILTSLHFPARPEGTGVDTSWMRSLVHFQERGLQAGVDWAFTLGPLGWLHSATYVPGYYGVMVAWALLLTGLAAIPLTDLISRMPDRHPRLLAALLLFLLLPLHVDGMSLLGIAGWALVLLQDPEAPPGDYLLGALFLVLTTWAKFTLGLLAVAVVLLVAAVRWRTGGVPFAVLFFSALMAAWAACGQHFSGLGPYFRSSLTLASFYSEAMPQSSTRSLLVPGLAALLGAAAVLVWYGAARPGVRPRSAASLAGILTLLLAWKAGFVREDPGHTVVFFPVAILLPWLVPEPPSAGSRASRAFLFLRLGTLVPFLLWFGMARKIWPFPYTSAFLARPVENILTLLKPGAVVAEYEREFQDVSERCRLPITRETVGAATIDVLGSDQELLLMNHLCWTPRPVFQSYAAYAEPLARMNERFFLEPRAPEFVLYRPEAIDGRLPAAEDGLALQRILERYRPELLEKSFLLLRRRPDAPSAEPGSARLDRDLAWGETLDLPAPERSTRVLSLDLRPTAVGKLASIAFRLPPVLVELTDSRGARSIWRLVPSTARLGFPIEPLLLTEEDAAAWFRGGDRRYLASLRILPDPAARRCFADRIGVRIGGAGP